MWDTEVFNLSAVYSASISGDLYFDRAKSGGNLVDYRVHWSSSVSLLYLS